MLGSRIDLIFRILILTYFCNWDGICRFFAVKIAQLEKTDRDLGDCNLFCDRFINFIYGINSNDSLILTQKITVVKTKLEICNWR